LYFISTFSFIFRTIILCTKTNYTLYVYLSSSMTYHRIFNKSSTTGAHSGTGNATLPEHLNSSPIFFLWCPCWSILFVLCSVLSAFYFVGFCHFFALAIAFSVYLWITSLDFLFGIFKLFLLAKVWTKYSEQNDRILMLHVFIIRIGIMYKQRIAQLTFQYKNVFHYQHFVMCTRFA